MAFPRWVKWALGVIAGLGIAFVVLVGAALWYLSSRASPDVAIGEAFPAVQLVGLDGAPIDLEDYRGQVLVLDFWSSG